MTENPVMRAIDRWVIVRVLLPLLAGTWAGCERDPQPSRNAPPERDLGLKMIPTGEKPARAPGYKGTMINMPSEEVRIILVPPASDADHAGFRAGDVILAAGGQEIATEEALADAMHRSRDEVVFYEVRRGHQLLTLGMTSREPGWLVLSGDTFKGFLLTRIQSERHRPDRPPGSRAGPLELPSFDGATFRLASLVGRPAALMFWGTFSEPCYVHLQALHKACLAAGDEIACVAIDTMELFTAVSKTEAYQHEMEEVRRGIWPREPIPVDLFMKAERIFGIHELPSLVLLDARGFIIHRHDGPFEDPLQAIPPLIEQATRDAAGRSPHAPAHTQ